MDAVAYVRRVIWLPTVVPFVLVAVIAVVGSSDGTVRYSIREYLDHCRFYGAFLYPVYVAIALYNFRESGVKAHWALLFATPIAFPIFYASVNATLWYYETDWGTGLYSFFLYLGGALGVPIGLAFALIAWGLWRVRLLRRNAA